MWILIFTLVWPDGDSMKIKAQVLGTKHHCEAVAQEIMAGPDVQEAMNNAGATVEWECKQEQGS